MRIAIFTAGTRGDTQPYVALGHELTRRGHSVQIAASEDHTSFIEKAGLCAVTYRGLSFRRVLESEETRAWLARGNLHQILREVGRLRMRTRHALVEGMVQAAERADAIVTHPLTELVAHAIAHRQGIPLVRTGLVPSVRTGDFPCPFVTTSQLPTRTLRRWTHDVVGAMAWRTERVPYRLSCAQLGVKPLSISPVRQMEQERAPCVHMVSPTLLPRPSDWPTHHVMTGHCGLSHEVRTQLGEVGTEPELDAWLSAGPPPVYFGFGSLPILDPVAFLAMVRKASQRAGVRALISAGWSRLPGLSGIRDERMYLAGALDHDAVLPRCLAAVHHGGLGTTTAALQAGLPALVCAVFLDQPFWGARIRALGAGDVVPFAKLDEARLQAGLQRIATEEQRDRARALASEMQAENGSLATATFVENNLQR